MGCSFEIYRPRIGVFSIKLTNKKHNNDNNNNYNKISTTKLLILLLILSALIPNTQYQTHKAQNKKHHITNGNNTLKLLHWNKGKVHFNNKTNDIDSILSHHRPDIISLCEANIDREKNNQNNNNYKDYRIEHTKMSINTNQSRNILMIKEDIV